MKHLAAHPHYADGWNKRIIALIVGFYAFAAVGSLFPSWEGIALLVALYVITGFGVTVWYHRFFTHGSFDTYWPVWSLGAVTGLWAGEGPPIFWVGWHALHHEKSDTKEDPHSPHFGGFLHAHQLWMMAFTNPERYKRIYLRYTPRWMLKSKFLLSLNHTYKYWNFFLIGLLALSGAAYGYHVKHEAFLLHRMRSVELPPWWSAAYHAASFVGYGYFVRMILVLNATWSVNSISHLWGSQPYKAYTRDQSRNNLFVAIVACGEGYHHNHHVCPTAYKHGVRWWDFDPSGWFIRLLWLVGLAKNLKPFKLPPLRREAS
jgi:stearoyl-CoA desaturase (delta-9 desaturase)